MKELKGTKTEQNLMAAFAGESQAHTKYLYYASKAKKDGYVQMASLFEETAKNILVFFDDLECAYEILRLRLELKLGRQIFHFRLCHGI